MLSSAGSEPIDGPHVQPSQKSLPHSRSRSNTSHSARSRPRPQSRASTTSIHSFTTQPSQQHAADMSFAYQQQQQQNQHQQQQQQQHQQQQQQQQQQEPFRLPPEGMLMPNSQSMSGPHQFPLDPSLQGHSQHGLPYVASGFAPPAPMTGNPDLEYTGFPAPEDQMIDPRNDVEGQDTPDPSVDVKGTEKPSKKSSNTSAQNDLELKRLFRQNENKSLQDIATQLQGNERGPQSEKTRQIFAMLWLNVACKKSSGSVPRGRVYGHYVSRCGTERVTVLNPASFGKLVRVMFPAIQTRRLGMRGESKYHYCGLSLQEDQPTLVGGAGNDNRDGRVPTFQQSFGAQRGATPNPQLPADIAVFPSPTMAISSSRPKVKPRNSRATSSLFWDPDSVTVDFTESSYGSAMIERDLCFPVCPETTFRENDPIDLPNINLYIPPGTDQDTAAALTALYRSNCTSLIDCVRFCREKPFFHFFTSFHGTLTVPVQKLLANPAMAPWIKECDWLMYQKMIRVVAPLTLQVVPKPVVDFLKAISKKLGGHIKSSFQSHPPHVIEAKLEPATIFASLLDRALRVNLAAHAAANILCNDANRDQMYEEWIMNVETVKIVQNELPNCGYSEVLHILTNEIRPLLEPVKVSWEIGDGNERFEHAPRAPAPSTEGVLNRWTGFLISLGERFPKADARTIMTCVNSVATAALRDITMNGGKSFGSWWITKLWLDEMLAWLAEKGGFMEHSAPARSESAFGSELRFLQDNASHISRPGTGSRSGHNTRFSSVDQEFGNSINTNYDGDNNFDVPISQNDNTYSNAEINSSMTTGSQAALINPAGFGKDANHDDSGIGMQMANEDLSMGKFGFGSDGDANAGLGESSGNEVGGDVVVC